MIDTELILMIAIGGPVPGDRLDASVDTPNVWTHAGTTARVFMSGLDAWLSGHTRGGGSRDRLRLPCAVPPYDAAAGPGDLPFCSTSGARIAHDRSVALASRRRMPYLRNIM
jgi:hypothetical protein